MVAFEVELGAYVLPADHVVWKCFPGKTYRFLEAVREARVVFLDIRGLGVLPEDPREWVDQEVLEIIAEDRWSREQERAQRTGNQAKGGPGVGKQDRKVLTFLKELIFDAKKGDLIILPAEGYRREVLIGELLDEPGQIYPTKAKDGEHNDTYVGRRVKWLPSKEKREFDAEVIKSLHSTSAFHIIKRSARQEIYEVAYQNFILDGLFVATFETSKQQFTTSDNAVVSVWFNALAAVHSISEGGARADISSMSFSDLGLLRSSEAENGELSIDIASPGSVLLHSAGVFALATMALFPLMEVDAQTLSKSSVTVKLHTVGNATNDCALSVSKAAEGIIVNLGVRRLQDACKTGVRAKEEATLRTKARLKTAPKKPS